MLSRFLTLFLVCFFAMNDPAGAVLREFEFSADHGEDWARHYDCRALYCSLKMRGDGRAQIAFFRTGGRQVNFVAPADGALLGELERVLAPYRVDAWKAFASRRRYGGDPEWSLKMVGGAETTVTAGGKLRKVPINYNQVEAAVTAFFAEQTEKLRQISSHGLESFSFEKGPELSATRQYSVHVSQDQRSMILLTRDGENSHIADFFIDAAAWAEFESLLAAYDVKKWQGFRGETSGTGADDFRMQFKYETLETIEIAGSLVDGASEEVADFVVRLERFFEKYRGFYEASERELRRKDRHILKEFFFSVNSADGTGRSFQIYRVMTPDGPRCCAILERMGETYASAEFLLSEGELAEFESLQKRIGLKAWDGYRVLGRWKRGAAGFTLSALYSDGDDVIARGRENFPADFGEKSAALIAFADQLEEKRKRQ